MAYVSDESGQDEVYVERFPSTGSKLRISILGGSRPQWRRDGKELFYVAGDGKLMAVAVKAGPTFEAAIPTELFAARIAGCVPDRRPRAARAGRATRWRAARPGHPRCDRDQG